MAPGLRRKPGWWRGKSPRVRLAVSLIVAVCLGWPASAVALALGVPLFEQTMLALSWLAPAFTAIDLLFTAQVHERQQEDQGSGEE
jgi:hypothetical protein